MSEVYNYGAGPAKMPQVVLEAARDQMMSFEGSGMSVMGESRTTRHWLEMQVLRAPFVRRWNTHSNRSLTPTTPTPPHAFHTTETELSHRGKEFDGVIKKAEHTFRELLKVPDNYKVIFMQGGGMSPLSMLGRVLI
jgi:phosphoserine aminotransferase